MSELQHQTVEMKEAKELRGYLKKARENLDSQLPLAATGFLLFTVLGVLYLGGSQSSSLLLDNTTETENIEDNRLGSVIVRNGELPQIYNRDGFGVCLYTSKNEAPLLLETEGSGTTLLAGNEVAAFDIVLNIPEEKLSREGLNQEFSIHKSEHCPVRSEPKIIVRTDPES